MGYYQDLRVWKLGQELARDVHAATLHMAPGFAELREQLRRSSLSIPTNIAEGANRGSDADFCRFLKIALGSAAETESLLLFAGDSRAIDLRTVKDLSGRFDLLRRMLRTLHSVIEPRKIDRRRRAAAPSTDPPTQ